MKYTFKIESYFTAGTEITCRQTIIIINIKNIINNTVNNSPFCFRKEKSFILLFMQY